MANIQGRVIYDATRVQQITASSQPIINISVVLYNVDTNEGISVLTNNNGDFSFVNVIDGNYHIIEAWGFPTAIIGTADYNDAINIDYPTPKDPPISAVTSPHPLANKIDSSSPNTLIITVSSSDILDLVFFDAPIINRGLKILGNFVSDNLITNADNGDWGFIPAGSFYQTIPATDPYPGMLTNLTYSNVYPPRATEVTVTNMVNTYGDWWFITDHTVGDETGRLLVVNGANPGAIFFKETITVKPNTFYCLTTWITNMNNPNYLPSLSQPAIGITVFNNDSDILYKEVLNELPPAAPVTWTEIGGVFNSDDNTELTITLSTENPIIYGNDYAIDDLSVREFEFENLLEVRKKADKSSTSLNEIITYDIVVSNVSAYTVDDVFFKDIIDSNTSFINGSILVNGSSIGYENSDPNIGFDIGDIDANTEVTVQFKVEVIDIPENKCITNIANVSYIFFESENGDIFWTDIDSNKVFIQIFKNNFDQQVIDVIESVALEQAALAHILNAEGEKIQRVLEYPGVTSDELLAVNESVRGMINQVSILEILLHGKLELFSCRICNNCCEDD